MCRYDSYMEQILAQRGNMETDDASNRLEGVPSCSCVDDTRKSWCYLSDYVDDTTFLRGIIAILVGISGHPADHSMQPVNLSQHLDCAIGASGWDLRWFWQCFIVHFVFFSFVDYSFAVRITFGAIVFETEPGGFSITTAIQSRNPVVYSLFVSIHFCVKLTHCQGDLWLDQRGLAESGCWFSFASYGLSYCQRIGQECSCFRRGWVLQGECLLHSQLKSSVFPKPKFPDSVITLEQKCRGKTGTFPSQICFSRRSNFLGWNWEWRRFGLPDQSDSGHTCWIIGLVQNRWKIE